MFLLSTTAAVCGYTSPYWLTFKQARDRGGHVKKRREIDADCILENSGNLFWKRRMSPKMTRQNLILGR